MIVQWKKSCALLERDAPAYSEGTQWRACGPSNNIQIKQNHGFVDNYVNNFISPIHLNYSNGVMPLQVATNEHEISDAKSIGMANACQLPNNDLSVMSVGQCMSHSLSGKSSLPRSPFSGFISVKASWNNICYCMPIQRLRQAAIRFLKEFKP